MTVFHVVEFSATEKIAPGVERTTMTYEIQSEDGRAVPHVFPLEWDASIICGMLNEFQGNAGRLLELQRVSLVKGWRSNDVTVAGWRATGEPVPSRVEVLELGQDRERVVALRGFSTPEEAEACADNLARLYP